MARSDADLVAKALLRFYRQASQRSAPMRDATEITGNLELVVRLALGRQVEFVDSALNTPNVSRELARAAIFFIQQSLFRENANHYQVLGLPRDARQAQIRHHHRLLIQLVHPDRPVDDAKWHTSFATRVNRAYSVLKNPETRAVFDQSEAAGLRATLDASPDGTVKAAAPPFRNGFRKRAQVPVQVLPEWLTVGVGGFVRQRPVFTVFATLTCLCLSTIGGIVLTEREGTLMRGSADNPVSKDILTRSGFTSVERDVPASANSSPDLQPGPRAALEIGAPAPLTNNASPGLTRAASGEGNARMIPVRSTSLRAPADISVVSPPPTLQVSANRTAAELPASPVATSAAATPSSPPPVQAQPEPKHAFVAAEPVNDPAPPAQRSPAQPIAAASAPPATASAAPTVPVSAALRSDLPPSTSPLAPSSADVETLIAAFISYYESGRLDPFTALFDIDATTDEFRGRDAIRSDYRELFRRSSWRKISLRQMRWRANGERTEAKGEFAITIGWRDGREVEQRIGVEMELMRRGDRTVIARLSQQLRN